MAPTRKLVKSSSNAMTSIDDLEKMIEFETKRKKILDKYISDNLKEGVDYGKIHINKNCQFKYELEKCKNESHWSKNSLFKPGSEKFCSLMYLQPVFKKDVETYEMAGSPPGLFCYICELIDKNGKVVGEGRGAASINEKSWAVNNAIKIAEKRAQIDAILRTGKLSDQFTQDAEDFSTDDNSKKTSPKTISPNVPSSEKSPRATPQQVKYIYTLLSAKKKDVGVIYLRFKVKSLNDLSFQNADSIIKKLNTYPDSSVKQPDKNDEDDFIAGLEKDKANAENKRPGESFCYCGCGTKLVFGKEYNTYFLNEEHHKKWLKDNGREPKKTFDSKMDDVKKSIGGNNNSLKNEPATNYEIGWVRAHWSNLVNMGLVLEGQKETIDFMTKNEVDELKIKHEQKLKGGD